jgi:hypothetical protein
VRKGRSGPSGHPVPRIPSILEAFGNEDALRRRLMPVHCELDGPIPCWGDLHSTRIVENGRNVSAFQWGGGKESKGREMEMRGVAHEQGLLEGAGREL